MAVFFCQVSNVWFPKMKHTKGGFFIFEGIFCRIGCFFDIL